MGSIEQVWEPQLGLFYSTALKAFDIFGLGIQIHDFFFGKICLNKRYYHNLLISTIFLEYPSF